MQLPAQWLAAQFGVAVGSPEYYALIGAVAAPPVIFAVRTSVTLVARAMGLSHPNHYRLWPRLPWRSVVLAGLAVRRWYERAFVMGKRATGGFAGMLGTLALLHRPGKVLLGRAYALGIGLLQPVGMKVTRHLFMYAMTGAGKTTALMTIIATWRGSVFVIDPKGQITRGLSSHDRRRWYVIDPYHIAVAISACFNAFDCISEAVKRDGEQAAVLWAIRIAHALVVTPPGARTPFFSDTARGFLVGVILHVFTTHPENEHNLPFVRDLIVNGYRVVGADGKETTPEEAHALLLRMMLNNPAFDGAIQGAAAAMASASGETGGNVRATLQEQTKWLDIPEVRAILRASSFSLAELKTCDDIVLSFAAQVFSIRQELSPLTRLLTNMTAYTFEAIKQKKGQCLTVIDELPSQGHNETLEVMLAVARSYGQTVLGIAQNIELMRLAYPKSWGMFSGEADAVFWMATNHDETAEHLSRVLGKKSLVDKDRYSGQKHYREVQAMDPDQVKRFLSPDSGHLIVTRAGGRALKLMHEPYFKALPVWCYAADPDHREALLRRISRWLFDRRCKQAVNANEAPSEDDHDHGIDSEAAPSVTPDNVITFPHSSTPKERSHDE